MYTQELSFFDLKQSPIYRLSVTNPFIRHVDSSSTAAVKASVSGTAPVDAAAVTHHNYATVTSARRLNQRRLLESNVQINQVRYIILLCITVASLLLYICLSICHCGESTHQI